MPELNLPIGSKKCYHEIMSLFHTTAPCRVLIIDGDPMDLTALCCLRKCWYWVEVKRLQKLLQQLRHCTVFILSLLLGKWRHPFPESLNPPPSFQLSLHAGSNDWVSLSEKLISSHLVWGYMSRCTVIRTFLAIFPTAPTSYATIFFGVQRTLYWSN